MRDLTRHLYEYFYFTKVERNASAVLCLLCLFFFLLPNFYHLVYPPAPATDFSEYRAVIAAITTERSGAEERRGPRELVNYRGEKPASAPVEYFNFDPNTATKEDLLQLGMTPRTAGTLLNFRAKGGSFSEKEDLKKVYGLRQEDYDRLEAWITIESRFPEGEKKTSTIGAHAEKERAESPLVAGAEKESWPFPRKEYVPVPVDVNQATAEEWQQLRGIGPGYARRIVNFRDKLGGFVSVEQVAETYGLPDSVFQQISSYLLFSPISKKIKVNECNLDELKAHPYINSYQATILFNYRKQHGPFTKVEDLKQIKAGFTEDDWERLVAYFSFE